MILPASLCRNRLIALQHHQSTLLPYDQPPTGIESISAQACLADDGVHQKGMSSAMPSASQAGPAAGQPPGSLLRSNHWLSLNYSPNFHLQEPHANLVFLPPRKRAAEKKFAKSLEESCSAQSPKGGL